MMEIRSLYTNKYLEPRSIKGIISADLAKI